MDSSKLGKILDLLDPEHIAGVFGNDHEMARESFHLTGNTVSSHKEFYDIILKYYRHHFSRTIASGTPVPEDVAAGEARRILERSFREYGGYEGAYKNAISGKAGGMVAVVNAIATALRQNQEELHIENVFYKEIDPMDYEEIVELMVQLLDRFGGYLSPSERARDPHDLVRNYDELIKMLARSVSSVRGMVKKY